MKGAGCLFTILVIVASLVLLFALNRIRPASLSSDPHRPPPEPHTVPDPDRYLKRAGSLREFDSSQTEDSYRLHYGFIDYSGNTHRIECSILRADHERETAAYGYVWPELKKEIDRRAQRILDREIERRRIQDYLTVRAWDGGGYQWRPHYPAEIDSQTYAKASTLMKEMIGFMKNEYPKAVLHIRQELYLRHGFILKDNTLVIDHGTLVLRNQYPLANCTDALLRSGTGYNERQYLGLYLAFFQEIQYEIPPKEIDGKYVQGLYVPTEVLVNDHGDCDSKSLAFAAMIRSLRKASLVIDLPAHVLVAVESRPGPGQQFVRIGNRYFVLCEVAGPGKLAPGNTGNDNGESGYFDYTLIEPASAELTRDASSEGAREWK